MQEWQQRPRTGLVQGDGALDGLLLRSGKRAIGCLRSSAVVHPSLLFDAR
jgi:hypothetical protein